MGILSRYLAQVALFSSRHSIIAIAIAVVLSLVSLLGVARLSLNLKATGLLPKDLPALEEYREQVKDFGRAQFLIVIIEPPEGVPLIKYRRFISRYKNALENLPATKGEYLNLSPELIESINNYILRHGVYLVDKEHLELLNERLSPQSMAQQLALPAPARVAGQAGPLDPLGLIRLTEQYFLPSEHIRPDAAGYYVARDERLAFFIFGSTARAGQTERTQRLLERARMLEDKIWKDLTPLATLVPAKALPPPHVHWTGLPVILLEDRETLQETVFSALLISIVGVTCLFLLFFRSWHSLIFAFIPILTGVLWSFGFAGWTLGELNIATAGIGAILVGLSIDFPVYLLNAFYRRRNSGDDFVTALQSSWSDSGRSVFFGVLTTSGAFFMLFWTQLESFHELGLVAGAGLILTFFAVILLLPALLTLFGQRPSLRGGRPYPRWAIQGPLRKSRLVILFTIVLFVGFGVFAPRLKIDMSHQEMHAEGAQAQLTLERFADALDNSLQANMLIVSGKSWDEALQRNEEISRLLARYEREKKIKHYDSLSRWLPSQQRRREIQTLLPNLENLKPSQFRANYDAALKTASRNSQRYRRYGQGIERALKARAPTSREELKRMGLGILLDRYTRQEEYQSRIVSYIYPLRGMTESRQRTALLEELGEEKPFQEGWAEYVSDAKILDEMKVLIRNDLKRVGIAIVLIIAGFLGVTFRSIRLVLIGMIPMFLGLTAMLGSYALLKEYLSGTAVLFVPVYAGLAIDDAIHLINQWKSSGHSVSEALSRTGIPILFTSLTTMIGFGSLMTGPFPVMQQIGLLMLLAMGWELIASLVFLPGLLALLQRNSKFRYSE